MTEAKQEVTALGVFCVIYVKGSLQFSLLPFQRHLLIVSKWLYGCLCVCVCVCMCMCVCVSLRREGGGGGRRREASLGVQLSFFFLLKFLSQEFGISSCIAFSG